MDLARERIRNSANGYVRFEDHPELTYEEMIQLGWELGEPRDDFAGWDEIPF